MRTWVMLVAVALAMAGCAEEANEGTDDAGAIGSDDAAGNATVETNNTAPVATLTADAVNGTAPLNVTLSLDATDAEDDNLTWSLIQNGTEAATGEALPASFEATLAAGNHTFVLTVDDGQATGTANLTIRVAAAAEEIDPDAPVDMGWYVYDPVTEMCHVKSFTAYGGTLYTATLSGGNWVLAETNDEAGLQVEDNHPASGQGAGFELDVPECKHGDLVVV